jgi:hypothetical protein
MRLPTLEQLAAESDSLVREWESLPKDDPDAVREHLAKLRALAVYLNAHVIPPRLVAE